MQQGSGPISTSTPVAGSEAELNSLNNSNTFGDGEVTQETLIPKLHLRMMKM